jgi:ferredoxin
MAKVRFVGSINNKVIEIPNGKLILDEAIKNGINLPYGCRYGSCLSCMVEVIKGIENIDSPDTRKISGSKNLNILTCMSKIKKDGEIILKV